MTTNANTITTYTIQTTDGQTWPDDYASRTDAALAIARVYDWEHAVLTDSYEVTDPRDGDQTTSAWSAYETQEECDADADGARAPRIVRLRSVVTVASRSDDDDGWIVAWADGPTMYYADRGGAWVLNPAGTIGRQMIGTMDVRPPSDPARIAAWVRVLDHYTDGRIVVRQ